MGVGGVLKNLNSPIEESAAVLGVLANRGTKGSEAGTALNAILVNMQEHKSLELEASADWLTNLNSIGNVDIAVNADGAFSVLNTITGEIQTLQGMGATNLQVNADGNIDVLNKAQEVIATIDSKSAQINIDGQAYGLEQIQQAKQTADGLKDKSVKAQVVGSFNGQDIVATAVDYQSKLKDVSRSQTVTGKFPGKGDIATAISYQSQLHNKSVTHTVTYVQKGTPPANNATGTSSWRGGLTYVNDQNISDPREVIEHTRGWKTLVQRFC